MFRRKQQAVSEGSKHWYQDKYQHVLTQRNMLALIAAASLLVAVIAAFAVFRLAPLKSVQPYLIQIDEKTGITQRVQPITRRDYAADQGVDRYFTATYLRLRESYNISVLRYNYNVLRLMSTAEVFRRARAQLDPNNPESLAKRLGTYGQRDVKIRSMVYVTNPGERRNADTVTTSKILQARITTTESMPNQPDKSSLWIVTVTFEYADLSLNQEEQLLNPLGYTVTSYQIQPESE
ncbi:MAG: type IV secretion system protein [Alphaproteobacteria bacterium]|nr:type IV secretion system protein [Alphaproteobacteria bacterium]